MPGYQPRLFVIRQFTTAYTEAGAVAAGLVVALLVGRAYWLALRPASQGPTTELPPEG